MAILITSLVALFSIFDLEEVFLKKAELNVDRYRSLSFSEISVLSEVVEECKTKPEPDICPYSVRGIPLAQAQNRDVNQWQSLFKDIDDKLHLFENDKSTDLTEVLAKRRDLSKTAKIFIRNVFILGGLDQSLWAPYEQIKTFVERYREITASNDTKLFGLFFFVVSFSTLFAKRLFASEA